METLVSEIDGRESVMDALFRFRDTLVSHIRGSLDASAVATSWCTSHTAKEEGSYLRLIDFLYHSTLGLSVIKKKK